MMEARRKQKNTTTPAKKKAKKAKAKTGVTTVTGPMRSIAIGQAYLRFTAPVDDEGRPQYRSVFDPQGHFSEEITDAVSKGRVVNNSTFTKHINETVARRVFGQPLRQRVLRMFLEGIANECLTLTERGWKVKLSNFVVAQRVTRKARKARNPKTGETVDVPARTALSAKPTRAAKAYMAEIPVAA